MAGSLFTASRCLSWARSIGLGMGLLIGGFFALLVLVPGFVYGDACRRNMPAVPWTLIALFVPNLLGFLLYFVLRKPLATQCPQCGGQAITSDQRFCQGAATSGLHHRPEGLRRLKFRIRLPYETREFPILRGRCYNLPPHLEPTGGSR